MAASNPVPSRGRPFDTRLGEDLAVLCALSREGAAARAEDISALLGIDSKRAAEILHCVSANGIEGACDENMGPMLALYGTDERGSLSQVAVAKAQRSMALRLTEAQAQAVSSAFDRLGIGREDAMRQHVEAAFFPLGDDGEPAWPRSCGEPEHAEPAHAEPAHAGPAHAGPAHAEHAHAEPAPQGRRQDADPAPQEHELDPGALPALVVCARSQVSARAGAGDPSVVEQRAISFSYQGNNDQITRTRRAVPRAARLHEGQWLVDAYDLDARAPRSFLANRMESPKLLDKTVCVPREASEVPGQGSVRLSCTAKAAARVRSWPGAREQEHGEDAVVIEVPYYRGDWLPRHLLALGDQVSFDNPELSTAMREIAEDDLRRARRFRS